MITQLIDDGPDDQAFRIDDRHTVDYGEGWIVETHRTRDGQPMMVLYHPDHGYLVAVNTRGES